MLQDGIQSEGLNKIRSNAGDKQTSSVDTENKLNGIYGTKYRIRLDHQILNDHGTFYPQALYYDLVFELKLAPASQVVRGSDPTKLKYKLTNIQLEYEMIRSKTLADEALSTYSSGKEFPYDHIQRDEVVMFAKGTDTRLNIRVNPQRRSLKGILLLFVEPYVAGARQAETYLNPDLTKVSVTVNGSPNRMYNNGLDGIDVWEEVKHFFLKAENKTQHMNATKFYTENKFGLMIDLRSMAVYARKRHATCKHKGWSTAGAREECKRLWQCELPHLRNQRRADEYIRKAIRICAVLIEMDPSKIPFNALIVGPTNSGKSKYVVDQIYGPFRGKFDYIVLICPTFTHNKTYHRIGENDPRMIVIICKQHEVEIFLNIVTWLFEGTNTLIILDDCAASKDVKGRTGQLVNLGFSARHIGISVWVLTQKITSITPSFRENVAAIVLFYTPSAKTTKAIFEDYAGELSHDEYKSLISKLKERKFSYLVFSLRYPYGIHFELKK